jgi:hypothetical protein
MRSAPKNKFLSILLSFAIILSLFSGLTASAADPFPDIPAFGDEVIAPQPWPSNNTITAGGEYTIPAALTNTTVTVTIPDPVTLIGKGFSPGSDFTGISIAYTVPGANLTLREVYITSPNGAASIIDFTGVGNTLRSAGNNILESNGYNNNAVVHVGTGAELDIVGDDDSNLYLYKSSVSAAVGGNEREACGAITFSSGSVFAKGTQTGATIGGDDATGGPGHINGDITIRGGQLSVETNAHGAAIGASSQGECAGNVFIMGGKTSIYVAFSGSAIGRGAEGATAGDLYITGGSLEVYVDQNAAPYWGNKSGPNDLAITADISLTVAGVGYPAKMAAFDISGLDPTDRLNATVLVNTGTGPITFTAYNEIGLNQYDYAASKSYTPDNWHYNRDDTTLYLFIPITTATSGGSVTVTDANGGEADFHYSYNGSGFDVTTTGRVTVGFSSTGADVLVNGVAVTSVSELPLNSSFVFAVQPYAGNTYGTVTSTVGTVTELGGGYFKLSGITDGGTVTVDTTAGTTYTVSFYNGSPINLVPVLIGGYLTNTATVDAGGKLVFGVEPHLGYAVSANATPALKDNGGGLYTASNISANLSVSISESPADVYTVDFIGDNMTVKLGGEATQSALIAEGASLTFTIAATGSYTVSNVIASNGTVSGGGNTYTLSGVTSNTRIYVIVTPQTLYNVTFSTSNSTVYVDGGPTSNAVIEKDGELYFTVVPSTGYAVTSVTASNGTVTPLGGEYRLSGVTADTTVTVTTTQKSYTITFNATDAAVTINGQPVTSVTINAGIPLEFHVEPNVGYAVGDVTTTNGTLQNLSGGDYLLSGLTGNATVTATAVQGFNVHFQGGGSGGNMQVRIDGVATTDVVIPVGGRVAFTVVADLGYAASVPETSSGDISGSGGSYTLTGVTETATVTIDTSALSTYWTSQTPDQLTGAGTSISPYIVNTPADLAKVLSRVNSGLDTYAGKYIKLTDNIDLSKDNKLWAPIGGGRDLDGDDVPTGNYFAGTFDGGGNTIGGMKLDISTANDGAGAYGLFGYVKGGNIQNLTLSAAGGAAVTADGRNDAVGAVVGYTTGSIYNVTNNVTVTVNGAGSSRTGGIAGMSVDADGSEANYIQYCVNTANITGRSRLGGIVGEAQASSNGGVVIDQSYNTGAIKAGDSDGRAYVGGVVGYCMGYISNCYNTGNIHVGTTTTKDMHIFAGGIVGILNGANAPYASLSDSFNTGILTTADPVDVRYLEPLWANSDNSPNVTVSNCAYLESSVVDPVSGENKPQDTLGATVTNVVSQTAAQMGGSTLPSALDPTYFTPGSPNPTLNWQSAPATTIVGPIYVNPDGPAAGNGTIGSPFNNIPAAATAQSLFRSTICIEGGSAALPAVSGSVTLNPQGATERVVRWNGYTGDLVAVSSGGELTVAGGTVDGASVAGSRYLLSANAGKLTINNAVLKNNTATITGGALHVSNDSTLTVTGGAITGNTTSNNGGGIYANNSTVELNGAAITGNSSHQYGGGVYVDANASLTINGGEFSGNFATSTGGGIYIDNHGTSVVINAGVFDGNSSTYGANCIDVHASGTLTLAPNASGAITFGANDAIYLPNSAGTVAGQVSFNIGADLSTGVTGVVPLVFQKALEEAVIAVALDDTMAEESIDALKSGTIVFGQDDEKIIIASLSRS